MSIIGTQNYHSSQSSSYFPISHSNQEISNENVIYRCYNNSRSKQLAAIITGISIPIILSVIGAVPITVATTASIAVLGTGTAFCIAHLFSQIFGDLPENNEYRNEILSMSPFISCVAAPIFEELIFRKVIQGSLHSIFKRILPLVTFSVMGQQLPLAAIIAIIMSSAGFGLVHSTNDHQGRMRQTFISGATSLFIEGPLFYYYGLWASCLAHIINNTIAITGLELSQEQSSASSSSNTQTMLRV